MKLWTIVLNKLKKKKFFWILNFLYIYFGTNGTNSGSSSRLLSKTSSVDREMILSLRRVVDWAREWGWLRSLLELIQQTILREKNENLRDGSSVIIICRNDKSVLFIFSSSSCNGDSVNNKNDVKNQEQERKNWDDNVVDDENALFPRARDVAGHVGVLRKIRNGKNVKLSPQNRRNGLPFQHRICILLEWARLLGWRIQLIWFVLFARRTTGK